MQITKSFKFSPSDWDFGSKGFEVTVSHEEIGLPAPKTREEAMQVYADLSLFAEGLAVVEQVKRGLIRPEAANEALGPWLPTPPNSTSPTTGQGSPSPPSPSTVPA